MATIKERLKEFSPQQPFKARKIVSVKELGKRYAANFGEDRESAVFQIDGNIITKGPKCDKLILFSAGNEIFNQIFVELKGQDINHAIEQLEATVKKDIFAGDRSAKRYARIVGKSIPRSNGNSILDKAKIRFLKYGSCDLRAVGPGISEKFDL